MSEVIFRDPPKGPFKTSANWGAANGGLRDGGLGKSEDIWGKRPFSSVFWISQVLFVPSGKGRKRQKKGEKGRFRTISRKGGQTPLKPPFVTPPFAAAQAKNHLARLVLFFEAIFLGTEKYLPPPPPPREQEKKIFRGKRWLHPPLR